MSHAVTAGVSELGVDFHLPLTITGPAVDLTLGGGTENILAVYDIGVPEPSSLALLALSLVGLAGVGIPRRHR